MTSSFPLIVGYAIAESDSAEFVLVNVVLFVLTVSCSIRQYGEAGNLANFNERLIFTKLLFQLLIKVLSRYLPDVVDVDSVVNTLCVVS